MSNKNDSASLEVGDWHIFIADSGVRYMALQLPVDLCIIPIRKVNEPETNPKSWIWSGDEDAPSLSPSILHHSDPPWHGFLREGKLVEA